MLETLYEIPNPASLPAPGGISGPCWPPWCTCSRPSAWRTPSWETLMPSSRNSWRARKPGGGTASIEYITRGPRPKERCPGTSQSPGPTRGAGTREHQYQWFARESERATIARHARPAGDPPETQCRQDVHGDDRVHKLLDAKDREWRVERHPVQAAGQALRAFRR